MKILDAFLQGGMATLDEEDVSWALTQSSVDGTVRRDIAIFKEGWAIVAYDDGYWEVRSPVSPLARALQPKTSTISIVRSQEKNLELAKLRALGVYEALTRKLDNSGLRKAFGSKRTILFPGATCATDLVETEDMKPYQRKLVAEGHCMSDSDGYCVWADCPQHWDGEPTKSGRHCPRSIRTTKRLDPDDEGRAGG